MEGFITQYMRFAALFIILAMGLALLSNAVVGMNAPDEPAEKAVESNAADELALTEENATYEHVNATAEPPGYQDRAATIPGFGYLSGLLTLLFAYSIFIQRR
jgi:hypothetical protein